MHAFADQKHERMREKKKSKNDDYVPVLCVGQLQREGENYNNTIKI
jgi:hypothetical protein